MKNIKTSHKAPNTRPSKGKKLEIETQNPLRKDSKSMSERLPGANKIYLTEDDFVSDSDDDQEISAELTEAGVNEPQREADMSRDDARSEDREFELAQIGTEEAEGGLFNKANNDLENIPDKKDMKIRGVKVNH